MVKPLMLLPPLIFAGIAAAFLIGLNRDDPEALPSTLVGRGAPEVGVTAVEGYPAFGQAELSAPGVKLVNFFASWCAPCRAEHPLLLELAQEFPVYGINRDVTQEAAVGFLTELGNPYAGVVFDEKNRQSLEWGVYGLPETFILDGAGNVVLRFAGPITRQELERTIRPAIDLALATGPAG